MKRFMLIVLILVVALFVVGCTSKIEDVKNEENIGKTVTVSGTVKNTIKLGSLSGYTLEDETGTIAVSSQSLPKEGDKVTVSGALIKDTIFGYYIKAKE